MKNLILLFPLVATAQTFVYHSELKTLKDLPPGTVLMQNFLITNRKPGTVPKQFEISTAQCLDSCRKYGLKMTIEANGTQVGSLSAIGKYDTIPEVIGWYTYDEPAAAPLNGGLEYTYDTIRRLSKKPTLTVLNNPTRLKEASQWTDILGVDPYNHPLVSPKWVYDFTRAATVTGKPVWVAVNMYNEKQPSETDLRVAAYCAVAEGASRVGIFELSHMKVINGQLSGWDLTSIPDKWRYAKTLLWELSALGMPLVPIPTSNPMVVACRGRNGLIIVNSSRKPEFAVVEGLGYRLSANQILK